MSEGHAGAALVAERLTRRFGAQLAVDCVSFAVGRGEVFGFLGPNGAGKSTTARMLTGFVAPSEGRAWVAGIDVARQPSAARRHLGVVPEEANVYADLSVWRNVALMAELHGIGRATREARAGELLLTFGLEGHRRHKGRELSKGLRQRLMLCMALVSQPAILFLDEPTSGLDVASARLIRDVVARMNRERGMTVFVTTHNMEEAEQLCHRVAIIHRGRLAAIDTPAALRARVSALQSVQVQFREPGVAAAALLPSPDLEVHVLANGFEVRCDAPGAVAQHIAVQAAARGLHLEALHTLAPSLEDIFLSITAERPDAQP
jgi:ABC-2 type transport system ATP-binding protein